MYLPTSREMICKGGDKNESTMEDRRKRNVKRVRRRDLMCRHRVYMDGWGREVMRGWWIGSSSNGASREFTLFPHLPLCRGSWFSHIFSELLCPCLRIFDMLSVFFLWRLDFEQLWWVGSFWINVFSSSYLDFWREAVWWGRNKNILFFPPFFVTR